MIRNFFILYFIFIGSLLSAQEVVSVLISNPILLLEESRSNTIESSLSLPFFDDFSYDSPLVDDDFWHNSSVYVNRDYPLNPPTEYFSKLKASSAFLKLLLFF